MSVMSNDAVQCEMKRRASQHVHLLTRDTATSIQEVVLVHAEWLLASHVRWQRLPVISKDAVH